MNWNLNYIYDAISWLLLTWHSLWSKVVGDGQFLATNWAWALSIVFLVITIRVLLFPLFVKQIKSQRAMQRLQPKIKELQKKYKGDRETLQKEMMELYRTEKANPLMGCLPLLLQAPVFIGLLHVLRHIKPETTKVHFQTLYGWTQDEFLSAIKVKLFGAPIWANFFVSQHRLDLGHADTSVVTVKIVTGILVALMITTTFFTSRQMILKTGWNADPQQRMIQKLMLYGIPFMLLFSGGIFPSGVILYWVVNNSFSLGQQIWVLRKYPPPKANADATGSVTAKRGTKKYEEQVREKQERAKASAPKVGAKPVKSKPGGSKAAQELKRKQEQAKAKASQAPKPGAKPQNRKKGGATRGANK